MSHHKKKPSQYSQNKLAIAQQRNEFFRRLKQLCIAVGGSKSYSLIPTRELDDIFLYRTNSIKIFAGEGQYVHPDVLIAIKPLALSMLKQQFITLTSNGPKISIYEYFTIGITLSLYIRNLKDDQYPAASEFKKCFPPLSEFDKAHNDANKGMLITMMGIEISCSDLNFDLYCTKIVFKNNSENRRSFSVCIEMHSFKTEEKQIMIDGLVRPALRIGWPFCGTTEIKMEWISIKLNQINIDHQFAGLPLEAYIQQHALQRLEERLDIVDRGFLHREIFNSLRDRKTVKINNNEVLFVYQLIDKKVGYLKADICKGVIMIRTFLFITNNGTPESDLLQQNIGLKKEDKMYLSIDKLSTFVDSDITQNDKIKAVFIKSGCGDLFELDDQFRYRTKVIQLKSTAEQVVDYLGLGSDLDSE